VLVKLPRSAISRTDSFHRVYEAITAAADSFNVTRIIRRIIQHATEAFYCAVQCSIEFDVGLGPESLAEFLSQYQFPRPGEEQDQ
jgi:hypothetical protein